MREPLIMLALAGPAVLLAVALYHLDRVRRRESLFRWASENGYRLIAFGQPIVTEASAFPFSVSKAQHVFHVDVEDKHGDRRLGWVRLGSPWRGLASRAADVYWEGG